MFRVSKIQDTQCVDILTSKENLNLLINIRMILSSSKIQVLQKNNLFITLLKI